MAKAIYGHVGIANPYSEEIVRLRRHVADLEAEVMRLNVENDRLRELAVHDIEWAIQAELIEH